MRPITPSSAEILAAAFEEASRKKRTIELVGNNSKRLMGGPVKPADMVINTKGLRRVLKYEPNDLTISVEAGMPFAELQALLAKKKQMIGLDPAFSANATIGGIVAANASGPMRLGFGTARDQIIGMKFATLGGQIVSAGGMVVKNVAGLDMGKMLIGSFGTLAAMTSLNFRLHPLPEQLHTFLFSSTDLEAAMAKRDSIMHSVLRPLAMDIISPPAATRLGGRGHILAVRAGGSTKVLARYEKELTGGERLIGADDASWWNQVREFTADFLRRQPNGVVLRISSKISHVGLLLRQISGACISRAASGVTYIYLSSWLGVPALWQAAAEHGWSAAVEFAPNQDRATKELWLLGRSQESADAFAIMKKVKQMFDPNGLLNRSRLYGRL